MSGEADLRGFEATYAELEDLVRKLEGGHLSPDDSLACYERGIRALKECYRVLDVAEKRLERLVRDATGAAVATKPLDLPPVVAAAGAGTALAVPPVIPAPVTEPPDPLASGAPVTAAPSTGTDPASVASYSIPSIAVPPPPTPPPADVDDAVVPRAPAAAAAKAPG